MMEIKIHDVLHERTDSTPTRVEKRMQKSLNKDYKSYNVSDVRIAWGDKNSPIFIQIDGKGVELSEIQSIAREALRIFDTFVDGIDIDKTVREDNIRVRSSED